MEAIRKPIFFVCGWIALILGIIGAFLPFLPTTPFILLASYFFFRSSEKMHNWLTGHKTFGPLISDWERYGVIRKRPKILATVLIVVSFAYPVLFKSLALWMKASLVFIEISVLIFLWTRPSTREQVSAKEQLYAPKF